MPQFKAVKQLMIAKEKILNSFMEWIILLF